MARIVFLLLSVVTGGVGCTPAARPRPVDLSGPQSAAIAYVTAMQRGDAATARAASMGSEEEMRWVDALASMVDGMRQLNKAAYDRFGGVIDQFHTDLEDSIRTLADEPVEVITNGSLRVNENQGLIVPKQAGFISRFQLPIAVTKVKVRQSEWWKVDLERTYVPAPPREQLMLMSAADKEKYAKEQRATITAAMNKYRRAADAFLAVARDVRGKKMKSIEEVEKALAGRIAELRS